MLTLPGKRVQRAVSLVVLMLVASWCALKSARLMAIAGYYASDPSGIQIFHNAVFGWRIYLLACCVAIALATWIMARTLADLWDDMMLTVRYLVALCSVLVSVAGLVVVASILIGHSGGSVH
jgi:hypothetical protein